MKTNKLVIEFENPEQAEEFASWLCNSGEQAYFEAADYHDDPEKYYVNSFNYHNTQMVDGKPKYGKFMESGVIKGYNAD